MLGETPEVQDPGLVPSSGEFRSYCLYHARGESSSDAMIFHGSGNGRLSDVRATDLEFDLFSCDAFRMYEFKVRKCGRAASHDWTECPYAHPREKARRRDPRKFRYSATACPDNRKGSCKRGDSCEYAHGVFECWLHPMRYRTERCRDGFRCSRKVCFFAHTEDQLRVLRPTAARPQASPPLSPMDELLLPSMQQLRLWNAMSDGSPHGSTFYSHSATPPSCLGNGSGTIFQEQEEPKEMVDPGRNPKAALYENPTQVNFLAKETGDEENEGAALAVPDADWIADLVKRTRLNCTYPQLSS